MNRTSSFQVTVEPNPGWDGIWSAYITDAEGPQGKQSGDKMTIVGNSLELIGKGLDTYIRDRIENSWRQKPRRQKKRRR